jgi:trehalose 6-phosphate synthase/phosphatase
LILLDYDGTLVRFRERPGDARPDQGLLDPLHRLSAIRDQYPLHILQGSKVVEVKDSAVDKGKAARAWLERPSGWDFVLAAGDDVTDEDLFRALPEQSWSIRIGPSHHSAARYSLATPFELRQLLQGLAASPPAD